MKIYRILTTALLISLITTGVYAQAFVGGSAGLRYEGGKFDNGNEVTDEPSEFGFHLSPVVGKFISEKVAVGISLGMDYTRVNDNNEVQDIDISSSYSVSPFLRYYAVSAGKFSVFGQGSLGFSYATTKNKFGSTSTDGPGTTGLSFSVVPGLAYDITEKLSLETYINLLNLSYGLNTESDGDFRETHSYFNLGAGLDDIVHVGAISIGAIYKF